MDDQALVILITAPTSEVAAQLGCTLVEERLAACANIVPGLRSIYRWQGAVQDDAEVLILIKTTAAAQARLTQRILQLHPYETPEVIALPIVAGADAYLRWLRDQVDAVGATPRNGE